MRADGHYPRDKSYPSQRRHPATGALLQQLRWLKLLLRLRNSRSSGKTFTISDSLAPSSTGGVCHCVHTQTVTTLLLPSIFLVKAREVRVEVKTETKKSKNKKKNPSIRKRGSRARLCLTCVMTATRPLVPIANRARHGFQRRRTPTLASVRSVFPSEMSD